MSLYQIELRLARNPGYPNGDDRQGYIIVAPLDNADRLDLAEWRAHREVCTVVRFKEGEANDADGRLTHNGSHWFFHYDEDREGDDEPVFRLGEHRLAIEDYLTIHERDGQSLTYRVVKRAPYRVNAAGGAQA